MLRSKLGNKDLHGLANGTSAPTPPVTSTPSSRVRPAPSSTTIALSVGASSVRQTTRDRDETGLMMARALAEQARLQREEQYRLETLRRQREEEDKFNRSISYEQKRFDTQIAAAALEEQTDLTYAIVLYSRALEIAKSMQQIWNLKPKHYSAVFNPSIAAQTTVLGHLVRCYMATERHADAYKLCVAHEIDASINRQHLIYNIRADIQRVIRSKLKTLDINLRDVENRKSAESVLQESRNLLRGVGLPIQSNHELENLEKQLDFHTRLASTLIRASTLCAQDIQNLADYKPIMQQLNEMITFLQASLAFLDADEKAALQACQGLQVHIQPLLTAQIERERIAAEKALTIRIQQEINTTLSEVAQHLDKGNLTEAASLLTEAKKLATRLPADAQQYIDEYKPSATEESLEFTSAASFDEPLATLTHQMQVQSRSHQLQIDELAQSIIANALSSLTRNKFMHKQQAALLEPQLAMLQTFLSSIIQENWQRFNNRPAYVMQFLTQMLTETVVSHLINIDLATWLWHWSHANLKVDDIEILKDDIRSQVGQFHLFGSVDVLALNHPVIARKQQETRTIRLAKEMTDDTQRKSLIEQLLRNVYAANVQGNCYLALSKLKEARRNFVLLHNVANINHEYSIDTINESIRVIEHEINEQRKRADFQADAIVQQILDQVLAKVSQTKGHTVLFEKHMDSIRTQLLDCVKSNWHKFDKRNALPQSLIDHLSQVLSQQTVDIGYVTAFWHWSYANRKLADLNSACKLSIEAINQYKPEQSINDAVRLPIFQAQVVNADEIPMAVVVDANDSCRHTAL